jgi:hypothetical protein
MLSGWHDGSFLGNRWTPSFLYIHGVLTYSIVEEIMEYAPLEKRIVPNCCPVGNSAVRLSYRWEDIYGAGEEGQEKSTPRWIVLGFNDELQGVTNTDCTYCPGCGKKLPEIQRKKDPPSPLCKVTDGGYYCATCNERLHNCQCYLPEMAWEVKP